MENNELEEISFDDLPSSLEEATNQHLQNYIFSQNITDRKTWKRTIIDLANMHIVANNNLRREKSKGVVVLNKPFNRKQFCQAKFLLSQTGQYDQLLKMWK
jgi:hypothetical protein